MHGRWRFRKVTRDFKGEYLRANGRPFEHEGTDHEALALAAQFAPAQPDGVEHVEAVSVGCPRDINDAPGRLLVYVVARPVGRGWLLTGDLMHGSWHRSLRDAVTYGAFRTAGHASETRIINSKGEVTHIILIPSSARRLTLY